MTADQTAEPRARGTRRAPSPRLTECPVIVVLRARNVVDLVAVCDALVEEGIRSLEFTLTTPEMLTAMPDMVERYAASADVGAGTVTTTQEAAQAIAAGADYLVTPTMNLAVVETAVAAGVAVIPGGLTPTELAAGWQAGAMAVKIFPAQTVGPEYLRHLRGPFPDLLAVPSGGISAETVTPWLQAGAVAVSIGGPLLGDALAGGDLQQLRERTRRILSALS